MHVWVFLMLFMFLPRFAAAFEIQPFYTRNQSPLVQIFGLPPAEGGRIAGKGETELRLQLDLASVYCDDDKGSEEIVLDGEIYRSTLAIRHGITPNLELGVDLPYIWHRGGRLDRFIDGFHRSFQLPEGGREFTGRNRLRYQILSDGETVLLLDEQQDGIGDLLVSLSWQLLHSGSSPESRSLALRSALKLPTGRAEELTGSGSSDFSLRLAGSDNLTFSAKNIGWYGALGGMAMSQGEVMPDLQRTYVAFGTLGLGWNWLDWLALQIQMDGHTPFFHSDKLCQLDSESIQLTVGTVLALSRRYRIDFGITEDLLPNTAPDVVFHLAMQGRF